MPTTKKAVKKSVRKTSQDRIDEILVMVQNDLCDQVEKMLRPFRTADDLTPEQDAVLLSYRSDAFASISEELLKVEQTGTPAVLERKFREAGKIVLETLADHLAPPQETPMPAKPTVLFGQTIQLEKLGEAQPTLDTAAELPTVEAAAAVAAAAGAPVQLKRELPPIKLRPFKGAPAPETAAVGEEVFDADPVGMEFGPVKVQPINASRPSLRQRLASAVSTMRGWAGHQASDHGHRFVKHVSTIHGGPLGRLIVSVTDTGLLIVQTATWAVTVALSVVTYSVLAAIVLMLEDLVRVCQLTAQNVSLALARWSQPKIA